MGTLTTNLKTEDRTENAVEEVSCSKTAFIPESEPHMQSHAIPVIGMEGTGVMEVMEAGAKISENF